MYAMACANMLVSVKDIQPMSMHAYIASRVRAGVGGGMARREWADREEKRLAKVKMVRREYDRLMSLHMIAQRVDRVETEARTALERALPVGGHTGQRRAYGDDGYHTLDRYRGYKYRYVHRGYGYMLDKGIVDRQIDADTLGREIPLGRECNVHIEDRGVDSIIREGNGGDGQGGQIDEDRVEGADEQIGDDKVEVDGKKIDNVTAHDDIKQEGRSKQRGVPVLSRGDEGVRRDIYMEVCRLLALADGQYIPSHPQWNILYRLYGQGRVSRVVRSIQTDREREDRQRVNRQQRQDRQRVDRQWNRYIGEQTVDVHRLEIDIGERERIERTVKEDMNRLIDIEQKKQIEGMIRQEKIEMGKIKAEDRMARVEKQRIIDTVKQNRLKMELMEDRQRIDNIKIDQRMAIKDSCDHHSRAGRYRQKIGKVEHSSNKGKIPRVSTEDGKITNLTAGNKPEEGGKRQRIAIVLTDSGVKKRVQSAQGISYHQSVTSKARPPTAKPIQKKMIPAREYQKKKSSYLISYHPYPSIIPPPLEKISPPPLQSVQDRLDDHRHALAVLESAYILAPGNRDKQRIGDNIHAEYSKAKRYIGIDNTHPLNNNNNAVKNKDNNNEKIVETIPEQSSLPSSKDIPSQEKTVKAPNSPQVLSANPLPNVFPSIPVNPSSNHSYGQYDDEFL